MMFGSLRIFYGSKHLKWLAVSFVRYRSNLQRTFIFRPAWTVTTINELALLSALEALLPSAFSSLAPDQK
jgi:hypothetical protein